MAQTGYTPILIYSSSTTTNAPAAGSLTNSTLGSELAINITDGKLFYKDNANAVQVIAWKTTPTTAGGTGLTSYTAGDLLYYATGTTLSKLAIGASKTILTSSGTAPQWSASLDTTQGGTGLTTYTAGDLVYYSTGSTLTKLAIGANTTVLTSTGTAPQWTAASSLSIGTATNLAGGAQGSIPYQSGASTTAFLAKDTNATRYLANTGTSNNPAWAQIDLTNGVTGILPSSNGGTGNGFTKFTGPTTSEKTFTLPNSSETLLYSGGPLGTPSSGTVTNLTGTASININGTVGATTANTGKFTTLDASGNVSLNGGTFIFNDSGADLDARFEGDTNANLLFTDASTDRVGVGLSNPQALLHVNGTATFGIIVSTYPSQYRVFDVAVKTGIAPAGTAVIDITIIRNIDTSWSTGVAEVDISVAYTSNSGALQGHFKYSYITNTDTTVGGTAAITQMYNGSAGAFAVATTDFAVTRPSARTMRITYTNNNGVGNGNNSIAVLVKGFGLSSVSIT